MKMSDKDLDKLFSAQLADMEVEPSAAVWNNIKREVSGEEASGSKKSIIPFLQIAAGVIVLVSVALLFRPRTEKVALRGNAIAAIAANPSGRLVITPQTTTEQDMQVQDVVPVSPVANHRESKATVHTATLPTNIAVDTTNANSSNRVFMASNTLNNDKPLLQQTVTDQPIPKVLTAVQSGTDHNKPFKALAVNNPPALKDNATTAKKKKIRNLGDLLNVMIAKVDKRDKKIIEFNDEDDDDTLNPTHINLGLIQTRKDN